MDGLLVIPGWYFARHIAARRGEYAGWQVSFLDFDPLVKRTVWGEIKEVFWGTNAAGDARVFLSLSWSAEQSMGQNWVKSAVTVLDMGQHYCGFEAPDQSIVFEIDLVCRVHIVPPGTMEVQHPVEWSEAKEAAGQMA